MSFLLSLLSLFRPKNWLILLAVIINMALCCGIVLIFTRSFNDIFWKVSLGIVIVYLLMEFAICTPIGEAINRRKLKVKPFKKSDNPEVYEALMRVYKTANDKRPHISNHIKFYISETDLVNAYAFGSRTLIITRGMTRMPINCIEGIVSHEFGHINYYDSTVSNLSSYGNILFNAMLYIISLPLLLVAYLIDLIINAATRLKSGYLVKAIVAVRTIIMNIVSIITLLLFKARSRMIEYRADEFSNLLGQKDNLILGLKTIQKLAGGEKKKTFKQKIFASHPKTSKRIARLEALKSN